MPESRKRHASADTRQGSRILASMEEEVRVHSGWRRRMLLGAGGMILFTVAAVRILAPGGAPPHSPAATQPVTAAATRNIASLKQSVPVAEESLSVPGTADRQLPATDTPNGGSDGRRTAVSQARSVQKPNRQAAAGTGRKPSAGSPPPAPAGREPATHLKPEGDRDVAILSALLPHAVPETGDSARAAGRREVVERSGKEELVTLLTRCERLGGVEARLCHWRICSGGFENEPACKKF